MRGVRWFSKTCSAAGFLETPAAALVGRYIATNNVILKCMFTCCAVLCYADRLKKMAIKSNSGSTGTAAAGKAPAGRTAARAAARAAASQTADDSDEGASDFEDDLEVSNMALSCPTVSDPFATTPCHPPPVLVLQLDLRMFPSQFPVWQLVAGWLQLGTN